MVHLSAHLSLCLAKGVRSFLATAPCPTTGPRRCLTEDRRSTRKARPHKQGGQITKLTEDQGLPPYGELEEKGMIRGKHSYLCPTGKARGCFPTPKEAQEKLYRRRPSPTHLPVICHFLSWLVSPSGQCSQNEGFSGTALLLGNLPD